MTAESLRNGAVAAAIRDHRLIVVLRRVQPRATLLALVEELAAVGARAFEITLDAATAEADVAAVRERLAGCVGHGCLVGAGGILRRNQLEAARRAGADFGASTFLDTTLVDTAVSEGLPFIPGAFTPTEIHAAWSAGATFVKLFPASAVGATFVRELHRPMPDVELIAAGGLDAASAPAYLAAGAAAVGIGSAITRADAAGRVALVASIAAGREGAA